MELSKDLNLTVQQKERILDKIRGDNQGRNSFKGFLSKEFADENLLFVEAVEKFDLAPPDDRFEMGYKIFEMFIKNGSEKEVNVEAATRKKLVADVQANKIIKFMFKDASKEVLDTLRDDNLIRYMKSPTYETYIKRLREETETIRQASPGAKKTPKGSKKGSGKKSPGGTKKSPGLAGSSPNPNRPSPETADTFDDVLDLMFQVYEDVFEQSFGDTLVDLEIKHKAKNKTETESNQNINDFEMFLAATGGEAYAGTPPVKKKKEKKEKDKGGSDTPTKKKKSSFFQRMTDDNKKKDKGGKKKKGDEKDEKGEEKGEEKEEKEEGEKEGEKEGGEEKVEEDTEDKDNDSGEEGEVLIIQKVSNEDGDGEEDKE